MPMPRIAEHPAARPDQHQRQRRQNLVPEPVEIKLQRPVGHHADRIRAAQRQPASGESDKKQQQHAHASPAACPAAAQTAWRWCAAQPGARGQAATAPSRLPITNEMTIVVTDQPDRPRQRLGDQLPDRFGVLVERHAEVEARHGADIVAVLLQQRLVEAEFRIVRGDDRFEIAGRKAALCALTRRSARGSGCAMRYAG